MSIITDIPSKNTDCSKSEADDVRATRLQFQMINVQEKLISQWNRLMSQRPGVIILLRMYTGISFMVWTSFICSGVLNYNEYTVITAHKTTVIIISEVIAVSNCLFLTRCHLTPLRIGCVIILTISKIVSLSLLTEICWQALLPWILGLGICIIGLVILIYYFDHLSSGIPSLVKSGHLMLISLTITICAAINDKNSIMQVIMSLCLLMTYMGGMVEHYDVWTKTTAPNETEQLNIIVSSFLYLLDAYITQYTIWHSLRYTQCLFGWCSFFP
ncbi:membrane protein S18 [Saimiriine betaherpesvirus 4]|uniref:Membrane protein S18 n=1 Tax=Saimiriine betaherpesvirus 4 TaxID=1535247 RepID=G8XT39_9BETA|nr:membrane protein S18 [Saimiriine betaherpesvirus 4]AEV80990.1 membrane protein S18 [Saimiriine betaherpesvirus 4]